MNVDLVNILCDRILFDKFLHDKWFVNCNLFFLCVK